MKTEAFTIDTEVTPAYFHDLLEFIYQNYSSSRIFKNIRKAIFNGESFLFFTFITPDRRSYIDVEMKAEKPIQVKITAEEILPQNIIDELKEDLIINVQLFEEKVRKTTLYFACVKGEEISPEKMPTKRKKAVDRLFTETILLFYIILIGASIFLFFILGPYAIIIIAFQFIIVLFSDKIMAKSGVGLILDLWSY